MSETGQPRKTGDIRSIARAAAVLRALTEKQGMSLGEIAKSTGLARSTVQRLVAALAQEGFVMTRPGEPGVELGLDLLRLGWFVRLDVRSLIRPALEKLHSIIDDNIEVTILADHRALVIEQVASHEAFMAIAHIGRQLPLHCTANGKAHLSMLADDVIRDALEPPLKRYTPYTTTDVDTLIRLIRKTADGEPFVDEEEFYEGSCAIGIPVTNAGGFSYALSATMPRSRYDARKDELTRHILDCAAELRVLISTATPQAWHAP